MNIEEARGIAAQCWCDPETRTLGVDGRLAEAFAKRLVEHSSTLLETPSEFREFTGYHTACKVIVKRSSVQNATAHDKGGTILAVLDYPDGSEGSYAVNQFRVTASYEEVKAWLLPEST